VAVAVGLVGIAPAPLARLRAPPALLLLLVLLLLLLREVVVVRRRGCLVRE
jgi:hypothetical protein